MKKLLFFCLFIFLTVSSNPAIAAVNANDIKVKINGELLVFPDQKPIMENGRILIPVRIFSEYLQSEVVWDNKKQTVTILRNGTVIYLTVGLLNTFVNGRVKRMDTPVSMAGGRVMVPLRFVSEVIGAQLNWDGISRTVEIMVPNYLGADKIDLDFIRKSGYTREQIERVIAIGAIYDRVSGEPYNLFLNKETFPDSTIELKKFTFKTWWSINSRESAFKTIKSLREYGHRQEYDILADVFEGCSDEKYKAAVEYFSGQPEVIPKIDFIRSHHNELQGKSILGWDLCRLVAIAQDCYIAGYISREEALNEIMIAAKMAQDAFSSWEEMADNHRLGRIYWSGEDSEEISKGIKWLLTNKESPWVKYKWNESLEK